MTQEQIEKLKMAVRSPYNLLGLSVGVALTAVFLDVRPLLTVLGVEAVYLAISVFRPAKAILPSVKSGAAAPSARATETASISAERTGPMRAPLAVPAAPDLHSALPMSRDLPEVRALLGAGHFASDANYSREAALPRLRRELQSRYETLEGSLQMVKLMSDAGTPAGKEIPARLDALLGKFLFFAVQEERLRDMLEALRDEARGLSDSGGLLPRTVDGQGNSAASHLHLSSGAPPLDAADQWMREVIREAHEYFEREMADLAWRREHSFDPATNAALERRGHALLRRNKYVDKVAKMLKNTIYALQLIAKSFEATAAEINDRAPERILSDIKAIVLQSESMTRTLEELQPFEEMEETRVA